MIETYKNYKCLIEFDKDNKKHYYNADNKLLLLSFSSISKAFADKYHFIPENILEKARKLGEETHKIIETKEKSENESINLSVKSYKIWLKNNNLTEKEHEKHVFNDKFHGYIDVVCDQNCFLEIKTRNKAELDLDTVIQCELYKKLSGMDYHILHIIKKMGLCFELKPTRKQIEIANIFWNLAERMYNIINKIN